MRAAHGRPPHPSRRIEQSASADCSMLLRGCEGFRIPRRSLTPSLLGLQSLLAGLGRDSQWLHRGLIGWMAAERSCLFRSTLSRYALFLTIFLSSGDLGGGEEPVPLQDVVGECVPEDDVVDLVDAAHRDLPELPVPPAGMDQFADGGHFVLCLAGFARHPGPPSQGPLAVVVSRQIRISPALGFGRRAKDLDPLAVGPLDIGSAAKSAIGEMASGQWDFFG